MLKYINRKNTDCEKWDALNEVFGADDLLPLWVADMDFSADEHILDAVTDYVRQGSLGYYKVPGAYYRSFIDWEQSEHGLPVKQEWMRYAAGVVSGFHIAIGMLTEPGDAVIINTPVYYPFFRAISGNGCRQIESELVNTDGIYKIDFEDFESKIEDNDVKVYLLCSPHNPVSRVWTKDELIKLLEICRRHGVAVISDEIHHDLVHEGNKHIPALSLAGPDDRVMMLTSATKTFNIAGLQNAIAVIPDDELRSKWDKYTKRISVREGDSLGYIATTAAYTYGKPWLNEVKETIYGNYLYICEEFADKIPDVIMTPLEGTYLAWADFGAYLEPNEVIPFMQDKCELAFDYGAWFGGSNSGSFIRINLATCRDNLEEMVRRISGNLR